MILAKSLFCPTCSDQSGAAEVFLGTGRNPRGSDGNHLKCDNCGSTDHLWRRCDVANAQEYIRKRESRGPSRGTHVTTSGSMTKSPPSASSLMANVVVPIEYRDYAQSHKAFTAFNTSLNETAHESDNIGVQASSTSRARSTPAGARDHVWLSGTRMPSWSTSPLARTALARFEAQRFVYVFFEPGRVEHRQHVEYRRLLDRLK